MSETSIEWTHPAGFKGATWNPVVGCRRVSPGCGGAKGEGGCYAETMAGRLARMGQARYLDVVKVDAEGQPRGRWNGTFREVPEVLTLPVRTRRRTCYFVNSMSDLFGEGVSDEWIAAVFGVMAACPQHRFLILTKRAERMAGWFQWVAKIDVGPINPRFVNSVEALDRLPPASTSEILRARHGAWPLANVWLGVSVEDQQRADERIPPLFSTPAVVRFLSCEPLLEPLDLQRFVGAVCATVVESGPGDKFKIRPDGRALHWCIVGGESGHGARPFDLAWARSIREQCAAAGVAFFFKQAGAYPVLNDDRLALKDKKGGDLDELRAHAPSVCVREWPAVAR